MAVPSRSARWGCSGVRKFPGQAIPTAEGTRRSSWMPRTGACASSCSGTRSVARWLRIHRGQAGDAGPVKVTLFSSRHALPATINHVHGCVEGVDSELIQRIIDNPGRYYVNVHNRRYPAGAIRGELAGGPS